MKNERCHKILKESGLLKKGVSKTTQDKAKEPERWIAQYVARCLRCQFIRKSINRAGEDTVRAGQNI